MAFATSTERFQNIFMTPEPDKQVAEDFFASVLEYLSERIILREAALLYEWIHDGRPMFGFICRTDVVRSIADDLITNSIPFLCVTDDRGDVGFLIRACDNDNVDLVKKNVLERKAKFCKVVTSEELKEDLMKSRDSDKSILYISDLSEEQVEILQELCEEMMDEQEIGIDEMEDGTYTFSFPGKRVFKSNGRHVSSLNQLLALLMLRSEGLHADINKRNARNQKNFNMAMARGFKKGNLDLRKAPAWIVGSGKHYIKLDGTGFEYGHASMKDSGIIELEEQYTVDASAPDYKQQLNSYLARIENKTVTYDMRQAVHHLEGKNAGLDFSVSRDGRKVQGFERQLIQKASEFAMEKLRTDPVMKMSGHWDEKVDKYLSEVASLIDAARLNEPEEELNISGQENAQVPENAENEIHTIPDGYTEKQIRELMDIGEQHGLSLKAYGISIHEMRNIETTIAKASLERVKDVEKELNKVAERSHDYRHERGPSRLGRSATISKEAISRISGDRSDGKDKTGSLGGMEK